MFLHETIVIFFNSMATICFCNWETSCKKKKKKEKIFNFALMRNVKSQVWSQFLCGVLAEVATRNEFIRKRGELNEQQSIRTSPLEVLLSCLTLSFRTHRDHSGPGVSHVGYCTILLPNSTFTARLAGNEKKWNPVNILFSVCVCVCVWFLFTVVCLVCFATRNVFSKRTGWGHVTVLLLVFCLRFSCMSLSFHSLPLHFFLLLLSVRWSLAALVRLSKWNYVRATTTKKTLHCTLI